MSSRPSSPRLLPYLQVAIAATAWGLWSLFLRPAHVDPYWAAAIMLAVVTVATSPFLLRRAARGPQEGPPRRPREWIDIALLGVFDALNAGLFFAAMSETTIAVAVLSHYLAPLFVALAAPTILKTPRDLRSLVLAFVAACGLSLVLQPWSVGAASAGSGHPILGALLGAGSAVFYAANVLITKRLGPRFTAEEQLVYHSILSVVLLVLFALVVAAPLPTLDGAARVAFAGVLIGATAGLLFLYGLRKIPAEHAGILTFLEPLTAVLVAWIAFHERPEPLAGVGAAVVLGAGILAVRPRSRPPSPAVEDAAQAPSTAP